MNNMCDHQWFLLDPVDAWFFRDGKPFNRGEDQGDSRSLFPPVPSTTVGTLRYALAIENGWNGNGDWCISSNLTGKNPPTNDFGSVLGKTLNETGVLSFAGPLICAQGRPLFTMPLHVLGFAKANRDGGASLAKEFEPKDFLAPQQVGTSDLGDASLPAPKGLFQPGETEKWPAANTGFLLTLSGMLRVIEAKLPEEQDCIDFSQLFQLESRVGIARDLVRRSVEEGMLYNPHYVRLRDKVALTVGVRGIPTNWKVPKLIAFGGEARMAGLQKASPLAFKSTTSASTNRVVVILLTPVFFDNPWWGPSPSDSAALLSAQFSGRIESAAIDRPQRIGGWDGVRKEPIAKRPAVSAGSVWWVELEGQGLG